MASIVLFELVIIFFYLLIIRYLGIELLQVENQKQIKRRNTLQLKNEIKHKMASNFSLGIPFEYDFKLNLNRLIFFPF